MTLLPLPSLFLFLTSLPFSVISQVDERSTLLTLKRGLGDPPSLRLWNTTSSPCDWSEITCFAGNVTGISLKNKIITATVPTNICDFPNLETLDLSSNRFSGDFPTVLYNCTKLRHLDLSQNYFNGSLPADIDRLSPQLEFLNLGANAFSGDIPTELTSLSKLKSIFLDSNNLSGELPEEIISWKSLVTLSLSKNKLSGNIPRALGLLPRLVDLDLSENELSGEIPPEIGNLKFKTLNFSSNMLTGEVPDQLDNLAYETSFLNNTNLCADKPVVKLQDCRKVLRRSKRLRGPIFVMIVVIGALILAVTLVLTFVVVWNYIRKPRTSRPRDVNWALPSRPVPDRCGFVFGRDTAGLSRAGCGSESS